MCNHALYPFDLNPIKPPTKKTPALSYIFNDAKATLDVFGIYQYPKASCFIEAAPFVLSTTPADNTTNVLPCDGNPCIAKIVVRFSKSMNGGLMPMLTTGIFDGSTYVNAPVDITHTWSAINNTNDTLTLHLSWVHFPENSQIQWSLDKTNLKDTNGRLVATDVMQTFTTTAPTPTFAWPDTGQTQCYYYDGSTWIADDGCT